MREVAGVRIDLRTEDLSKRYFLLSRTARRPLDAIKIDRAFVRRLAAGAEAVIGHEFGCELVQAARPLARVADGRLR
jgi:EAL domain-containing protein (putative c-di-GMP-specific phosphodiesterase class I)